MSIVNLQIPGKLILVKLYYWKTKKKLYISLYLPSLQVKNTNKNVTINNRETSKYVFVHAMKNTCR